MYTELCQRLGHTEAQITELQEQSEQIRKKIQDLKWVNQNMPKDQQPAPAQENSNEKKPTHTD